jgi:beta-glucosidase/6-phospho-beta-glucosidase/beta-galactosidase
MPILHILTASDMPSTTVLVCMFNMLHCILYMFMQEEEKLLVKGSCDFLGINHYMTDIIRDGSDGDFVSHWGKKSSNGYFDDQVNLHAMT